MRETTPQVFLIAEPKLNWDEVERYLEVVGGTAWLDRLMPWEEGMRNPAFPDEDMGRWRLKADIHDAEAVVEFAGRGCYRSWEPGLNANVRKVREDSGEYLDNILSSKHGAVLEHAQFTFQFHDVSRVFTHELVRHRAGVAISQESLRFVRLTDLGFRIPPILAEGPETKAYHPASSAYSKVPMRDAVISIVERLEEFQRDAAEAFGLDDEGVPFYYKKEVTSALRRLAPIGLSTGMAWSANARTLRHVIAQRTAPGAEEEIRLVFDQVARRMRDKCPMLFGDFDEVAHESGVPAWVPEYEKV